MKRDWNLLRELLEQVEADTLSDFIKTNGCDVSEELTPMQKAKLNEDNASKYRTLILGHVELLIDAGLLKTEGLEHYTDSSPAYYLPVNPRLTMAGYDLLENMRNKDLWPQIKNKILNAGQVLTMDTISISAELIAKAMIH